MGIRLKTSNQNVFSISVLKQATENKYKTGNMPITFVPFFSKSKTGKGVYNFSSAKSFRHTSYIEGLQLG